MKNIYSLLAPIAIGLLVLELVFNFVFNKKAFNFEDTISNLGTGIVNQFMNLFVLFLVMTGYGYLHSNFALMQIELTAMNFIILLLSVDFLFYWFHRWGHEINILWAAHSPHHSSEEFNLAVGLRASLTQRLLSFSMFWPLTLIGFEPNHIYIATGVHLMLGYWHHTKLIPKLGWFEFLFNTPSHHRVHHGTNEQYLDKNYAEILIIWDRLFGTFEEEKEEVRYGILRHPDTYSTYGINFHFWSMLWQDCKETKSWWNKIRLWFMPLGWRPDDVSFRTKVSPTALGTPKDFNIKAHNNSKLYLIIQLVTVLFFMFIAITPKFELSASFKIIAGLLVFYNIESWKYFLDSRKKGLIHPILSTVLIAVCLVFMSSTITQIHENTFFAIVILMLSNLMRVIILRNSLYSKVKKAI